MNERYSRVSSALDKVNEKEIQKGRKPVHIGDSYNTIIYVPSNMSSEEAIKKFLARLVENRSDGIGTFETGF